MKKSVNMELKEWMVRNRWTVRSLSKAVGISSLTLSRILKGIRISNIVKEKVQEFTGLLLVNQVYLFGKRKE